MSSGHEIASEQELTVRELLMVRKSSIGRARVEGRPHIANGHRLGRRRLFVSRGGFGWRRRLRWFLGRRYGRRYEAGRLRPGTTDRVVVTNRDPSLSFQILVANCISDLLVEFPQRVLKVDDDV